MNELERYVATKFVDSNGYFELSQALKQFDDYTIGTTDDLEAHVLDGMYKNIMKQLISYIPQYAHLRNINTFAKHLSETYQNKEVIQ